MIINLSNHPSTAWGEEQLKATTKWGEVKDLPFPNVDPEGDEAYIEKLANEVAEQVMKMLPQNEKNAVHLMGEMNLSFVLVEKLKEKGVEVVASTSKRNTVDMADGTKQVRFEFVKFRKY